MMSRTFEIEMYEEGGKQYMYIGTDGDEIKTPVDDIDHVEEIITDFIGKFNEEERIGE